MAAEAEQSEAMARGRAESGNGCGGRAESGDGTRSSRVRPWREGEQSQVVAEAERE